MNERDYELLSRSLDGLLGANESAAFAQRLMDDPELGATKILWEEIDMAARDAYPKTTYKRPDLPSSQTPRWFRVAAAALIAVALGGLTWAAIHYFRAEEPDVPAQDRGPSASLPDEVEDAASTAPAVEADMPHPMSGQLHVPPSAAGVLVTGTVIDMRGIPIGDAEVIARARESLPMRPEQDVASTRTLANGTFELPYVPSMSQLLVKAPGYGMALANLDQGFSDGPYPLRIQLCRAVPVTGFVQTADGVPLAGAILSSNDVVRFGDHATPVRTGPEGNFDLPLGGGSLWVTYKGYCGYALGTHAPGIVFTARLNPAATVRARVMQNGSPVANGLVWPYEQTPISRTRTTDVDGFVTLSGLEPTRSYRFFASDGTGNSTGLTLGPDDLQSGTVVNQLIELPARESGTLEGVVEDPNGRGVPGAYVMAAQGKERQFSAMTDESGRYRLPLRKGRYMVSASIPPSRGLAIDGKGGQYVDVEDSGASVVHFAAEALPPAVVDLRDIEGEPVDRVEVCVSGTEGWMAVSILDLPGGHFRTFTPRRSYHFLDPESGNVGWWAGGNDQYLSLRLDIPTGDVTGIAVDAAGDPLPDIVIRANVDFQRGSRMPEWPPLVAQTDTAGHFVFRRVPQVNNVALAIQVPGYQLLDNVRKRAVAPGDEDAVMKLALVPANTRVSGRLMYADRTPAEGFSVRATMGPESWGYATSETDGYFQLYVAAGDYLLKAAGPDANTAAIMNVSAPVLDIEWVLPVPSPRQLENTGEPTGPGHAAATEVLAALSDLFASFASDAQGSRYPGLVQRYGTFMPDFSEVRNITGLTGDELNRLLGSYGGEVCYLGHLVPDEPTAMAFLDAYEAYGPEGVAGQDINTSEEAQQEGLPRVFQLREGIERFLITDINDPNAGGKARSEVPVMWELPGNHEESGGWVVYMDGHTEWLPYPGPFPMSEAFVTRVREIGGVTE